MRISQVSIRNFRNLGEVSFFPDPCLNLFTGPNAQGKTSILEAIGYLATLRSFRKAKPPELLNYASDVADIRCRVVSHELIEDGWTSDLQVVFQRLGESVAKQALINGKPCPSVTQYLSQRSKSLGGEFSANFHAVTFNPSDHDLVRGDPKQRRDYLNQVISAEDLTYLTSLKRYQKVLEQRNAVLKDFSTRSRGALEPFNELYDELAAELTWKRLQWLEKLSKRLNTVLHRIAPEQAEVTSVYVSSWVPENDAFFCANKGLDGFYFAGHWNLPSLETLQKEFKIKRLALERAEWAAQTSLLGPNRDDWVLLLGQQPLKVKGSQGEVRSTLMALKLCEIELFYDRTKLKPVFLLDDFSSELDRVRRKFLLNFILETDLQVFVTSTERMESFGRYFQIQSGALSLSSSSPETGLRAE